MLSDDSVGKVLEDLWFKGYDQGARDAYKDILQEFVGVFTKLNEKLENLNKEMESCNTSKPLD